VTITKARSHVVIVGAGPSAAVAALRLLRAGLDVTCFEQGDWPDRSTFGGDTPAGELIGLKQWSSRPAIRSGPADYPIDDATSDMKALNYNGVGGGSVLYNAQWPRMVPGDFRVHSSDGVGADWPLTYAELQPFYDATDRQFGVSGLGGNPAYPDGDEPPLPALPIGPLGLAVARAHSRLGWHWWPETNAILSAPWEGRRACVQRGTCGRGCDEGAKASADVTHWPLVAQLGGSLVTRAVVRRIVVDSADRATGVEWVDAEGRVHVHEADVVLCAANGIGTPRLLLASATAGHPDGLANDSGLVGCGLMLHPMNLVQGTLPDAVPSQGHNGGLINSLQFYETDLSRGFVRGARWALTGGGQPLALALGHTGEWGPGHHARLREQVGRRLQWVLLAEDLPEDHNRVTLGPDLDRAGLPGIRISYRTSDNTERMLAWHAERARESLEAAGAIDIGVVRARANGHFMGTVRMGDDAGTSVCDRWGFTHRVRNLGVIDGSVFPTASGMNPTTTICALALRTAEHLIDEHGFSPPSARRSSSTPAPSLPTVRLPVPAPKANAFTADERRVLERVGDVLIPEADAMPSASAAGLGHALLDELLRARPDLSAPLHAALADVPEGELSLAALKATGRSTFATLSLVVAGAYYLSPRVRDLLDWHSERGRPIEMGAFPEYISEGLLDHLVEA
jgi:choline dehydrogenase-like flavoprotein